MAAASRHCHGCGKLFTSNGYWSHLSQSRNPSCKAILSEQLTAVVLDSEISFSESSESLVEDPPPVSFSGDLFGSTADYSDDAFGQIDGDGIDNAEVDENKEDEDQCRMDYELEMSWERHRAEGSPSGFGMEIDLDDKGDDEDHTSTFDSSSRLSAEWRINESLPHIIRYSSQYPDSRAGAVASKGQTTDDRYSNALGSNRNPWAPFTSEIDWMVARWAKLRGPGSTAFSELLAINGVRVQYLC